MGTIFAMLGVAIAFAVLFMFIFPPKKILRVLIRVDVQNDFMPGGALPVPEGNLIVAILNRLSQCGYYDLIIDTQDDHPADHGSFASQSGVAAFFQGLLNGIAQIFWPDHCVHGTKGWEFHPELDRSNVWRTFPKGRDKRVDSYSGLFDNGRHAAAELKKQFPFLGQSTGLWEAIAAYAEEHGYDEIEIDGAGLALGFCVSFTLLDARDQTYKGKPVRVRLIEDATRAIVFNPGDYEKYIADLKAKGIEVTTSEYVFVNPNMPGYWPRPF